MLNFIEVVWFNSLKNYDELIKYALTNFSWENFQLHGTNKKFNPSIK